MAEHNEPTESRENEMARRTIEVAQLIEWVNTRLAIPKSTHSYALTMDGKEMTPEQTYRLGVASLLEQVLHATGNYKGFSYNATELNDDGGSLRDGYDGTRRRYGM